MVEKICTSLTNKIRKEMPDIDDERAEIINYGLQLVFGEIPKTLILIAIAWILGVLKYTILALLLILPYRTVSGGVHLKTHIGCIIATTIMYTGNAFLSQYIIWNPIYLKYIVVFAIWIFSMIMIKKYAPADTEEVPILREKERKTKKLLSYIFMTITLVCGILVKNNIISNILIIGVLFQTISITKFVYKITDNKYGYEEYIKTKTAEDSN